MNGCRICKGEQRGRCMFCGFVSTKKQETKKKDPKEKSKAENLAYLGNVYNQLLRLGLENTGLIGKYKGKTVALCENTAETPCEQIGIWDGFVKRFVPFDEVTDIDLNDLDKQIHREIGDPASPGAKPYGCGAQTLVCKITNKTIFFKNEEDETLRVKIRSLRVLDGSRVIAKVSVKRNAFNICEIVEVLPVLSSMTYRAYESGLTRARSEWRKTQTAVNTDVFWNWLVKLVGEFEASRAFHEMMSD